MMRPSPRQGRSALLDGIGTEDGRIGYVALTRARDLFVLAVSETYLPEFEPQLQAAGLKRAGLVWTWANEGGSSGTIVLARGDILLPMKSYMQERITFTVANGRSKAISCFPSGRTMRPEEAGPRPVTSISRCATAPLRSMAARL